MGLRVDARPFTLKGREYVRQIIRDPSPEIVCPKAAQMASEGVKKSKGAMMAAKLKK